jgi:hypothetical protein
MIIFIYSSTCLAYLRDYSALTNTWESDSSNAYISGKTTFDDGKTIINLFIISFEKEYNCKPLFKIAFLEGNEYGELLKTIPIKEGFVKLYVDDNILFEGPAVKLIYSNVTEFGASISEETLDKIASGNIIRIELVDLMDIKFNLNKSMHYIEKARESCVLGL